VSASCCSPVIFWTALNERGHARPAGLRSYVHGGRQSLCAAQASSLCEVAYLSPYLLYVGSMSASAVWTYVVLLVVKFCSCVRYYLTYTTLYSSSGWGTYVVRSTWHHRHSRRQFGITSKKARHHVLLIEVSRQQGVASSAGGGVTAEVGVLNCLYGTSIYYLILICLTPTSSLVETPS
jgi:hypothetical protein